MPATWTFGLVDGIGRPLTESGFLTEAIDARLVRQRTLAQVLTLLLPVTSDDAAIIAGTTEQNPHIKAYRTPDGGTVDDRRLVFYGSVWVDELGQNDAGVRMLLVTALDPLATLDKRYTTAQYPPTDAGELVRVMIEDTNTVDGATGITTNAAWIGASSTVDVDLRTIQPTIGSLVQQFSQLLDGIEAWIEPQELDGGAIGQFHAAPRRGADKPRVVFGDGDGTENNAVLRRTRNKALVENDARGYSETLDSQKTDPASIASIGRLVGLTSFTGETSQTVIDARTQGRLDQRSTRDKVAAYTATPGPDAPTLFDDFDVGDTVTLDYRNGIEWRATPRVETASLVITRSGTERLESVTFRSITG